MDFIEGVPKAGTAIRNWLARTLLSTTPQKFSHKKAHDDRPRALLELAHVLLQAIRVHAVEGDREDLESFKSEFERLDEGINRESEPNQILLIAGSADQALSAYNRQITRYVREQRLELKRMVTTLTETVTALSKGSERSYAQLEDLGWRLQKACVIEDIRVINLHLAECLQSLQQETLRQKEEAAKAITLLKRSLDPSSEPAPTLPKSNTPAPMARSPEQTPSTTLSSRAEAEAAMKAVLLEGSHAFAAVFTIKGIQAIEARSGPEGIEQATELFVRALKERLGRQRIYRWSQSCFIGLLERSEPLAQVQTEISRVTSRRMEMTIEARGRSTFIPLCSSAIAIPIFQMRSIEMLIEQIDASMRL